MSIRAKLIILVLVTSIAGASSIFMNALIMRPVYGIQKETAVLETLKLNFINYIAQVNLLSIENFAPQREKVSKAREDLNTSFTAVSELKYLPNIDDSIRSSLDTIALFSISLKMAQDTLDERMDTIVNIAEKHIGKDHLFTVFQLAWGSDKEYSEFAEEIQGGVFFMSMGIIALNKSANNTLANLESQYELIDAAIIKYERRARSTLGLLLLVVVAVPALSALMFANLLASRIGKIEIGISRMRDGDLGDRINVKSKDELGRLSRNVNDFTDALSVSIRHIQAASRTNTEVTDRLRSSVERVAETTDQATGSAQSISEGMTNLDDTVGITESAVSTVEEQLSRLESVLNDQVSMIEETSASVSEMIASVNNVSDITVKKKAALTNLVTFSNEGGTRLNETNRVISTVHSSVEEIQGTAKIIADIAAQTNLLAMNAAIEAAHAGDAGRGFAVVADEIRKLAEATSTNSKRIGGVMKTIITNIQEAVTSAKNTGTVFERVDREVSEASASFDEIAQSMEELKLGGTQILDAMGRLNDISVQVQDSDVSMRSASDANRKAIEKVEQISSVTVEKVKQITGALEALVEEMSHVTVAAEKADEISESLESEVKRFVIDDSVE